MFALTSACWQRDLCPCDCLVLVLHLIALRMKICFNPVPVFVISCIHFSVSNLFLSCRFTHTQDSHPVATDVLWACSLAHRLGPGALQELLQHVIRNVHCPTLLTEILHRCRIAPSGVLVSSQPGSIAATSPLDGTSTVVGRKLLCLYALSGFIPVGNDVNIDYLIFICCFAIYLSCTGIFNRS